MLNDPDLALQPLYKPERDFLFGVDICGDTVPVAFNHLGEVFVGLEPLPLQGGSPVVEKPPGPALGLVVPELAKGFLEEVGRIQSLVGLEERLQGDTSIQGKVLPVGKQGVLLPFDELAILI